MPVMAAIGHKPDQLQNREEMCSILVIRDLVDLTPKNVPKKKILPPKPKTSQNIITKMKTYFSSTPLLNFSEHAVFIVLCGQRKRVHSWR